MLYDLTREEDRFLHVLDRLCAQINEGKESCPSAEVLTASLRAAFPESFIPKGTGIAINDSGKATWYVDYDTPALPSWRPDVYWLRRRLMRLIKVPG